MLTDCRPWPPLQSVSQSGNMIHVSSISHDACVLQWAPPTAAASAVIWLILLPPPSPVLSRPTTALASSTRATITSDCDAISKKNQTLITAKLYTI